MVDLVECSPRKLVQYPPNQFFGGGYADLLDSIDAKETASCLKIATESLLWMGLVSRMA